MPPTSPKVFISYSHDSDEHCALVLQFSDQLREDGIDCYIDQYINCSPKEGWQRWMKRQIKEADFVLIVCTEHYLLRFDGEDREGGRGVTYEGAIITQLLYDEFQENTKFLPVIPDDGSIDNVPLEIKGGSTFCLGKGYEEVCRVLTAQPKAVAKPLGKLKHYDTQQTTKNSKSSLSIQIDRLPTVAGEFFGREAELQILDEALNNKDNSVNKHIIQFIASGGTGKTKLLRHWLNKRRDEIGNYIVWSFYSQGTSDSKQVSATPLFIEAFKELGVDYE